MIKSVVIRNFQAHVDSELQFDPGINVISGGSHQGKSSIHRALVWAITNRPVGFGFRNWDAAKKDPTVVGIVFKGDPVSADNSRENLIIRSKTETENLYREGGWDEGADYKALRSDVPAELAEIMDMEDHNLQGQFDTFFLLQDTPGEVAMRLNDAAGLSEIDDHLRAANQAIQASKHLITSAERNVEDYQGQLEEFVDLPKIKRLVDGLVEADKDRQVLTAQWYQIDKIVKSLAGVEDEISAIPDYTGAEEALVEMDGWIDNVAAARQTRINLAHLRDDLVAIEDDLEGYTDLSGVEDELDALMAKTRQLEELRGERQAVNSLAGSLSNTIRDWTDAGEALELAQVELMELMEDLEFCPTCLQPLAPVIGRPPEP